MKRLIYIAFSFLAFACEPAPYLGPLDSPVGNWEGVKGQYYFNGEMVAELDSCVFTAISFYKQGYCCIEGMQGAFPFIYDNTSGSLQIDSTLWSVTTLTGAEMVMKFVDRIYPDRKPEPEPEPSEEDVPETEEPEEPAPDANGLILPVEYKGFEINADKYGYFYINKNDRTVHCNFKGATDPDGKLRIDFWYDTHTNYFIPLVVEVPKK